MEKNFLAGRTFTGWQDLNEQALAWCSEKANRKPKRGLGMSPDEAYVREKPHLRPLPDYAPPVYQTFHRVVDVEAYVHLDTNRYSVPERLIGKRVQVQKHADRVIVIFDHARVASHARVIDKRDTRVTDPRHHHPLLKQRAHPDPSPEEKALIGESESLDRYVKELKKRSVGRGTVRLRKLLQLKRSLVYRIEQAAMPWPRTLDTFPFHQQPGVRKSQIMGLTSPAFLDRAENIVLIGDPGAGKTGLAIGLLRQALVSGRRGRFYKAQDLLDELYASLADRTTHKPLKRLVRYDLLVIDELGYLTLNEQQVNAFFKLMDERYGRKSTIITSNLDYPQWYDLFQRKSLVDALLDRLKHHCITIRISGPSLRIPTHSESQTTDREASKKPLSKSKPKTK